MTVPGDGELQDSQLAARLEYTSDFGQAPGPVVEIAQAESDGHGIEGRIGKRNLLGRPEDKIRLR